MYELMSDRHLRFLKWLYDLGKLEPPFRHDSRSSLTAEEVDLLIAPAGEELSKEVPQG